MGAEVGLFGDGEEVADRGGGEDVEGVFVDLGYPRP